MSVAGSTPHNHGTGVGVSRTMAPPVHHSPGPSERSKSGPSVPLSPARLVPVSAAPPVQPTAMHNDPTSSFTPSLRPEVERLQTELKLRTHELSAIRAEANSSAYTKHEVEELWRTIKQQSQDLEKSSLLEAELRSAQQRYEAVALERDRWMKECLSKQEQSSDAVTRAMNEMEALRDELRSQTTRLHDTEMELMQARRIAADAESALESQKAKVQRTTSEVKELQQTIQASRQEDRRSVLEAQQQVQLVTAELKNLEVKFRGLELQHDACGRREENLQDQLRQANDRLQLTEVECKGYMDELSKLRERLNEVTTSNNRQTLEQLANEEKANKELKREVVALRDTVDQLENRHRLITLELAECHGKLETERMAKRHDTEHDQRAEQELNLWKERATENQKMKETLLRQVDELRLELIQLNNEAENSASLHRVKSDSALNHMSTLEMRVQELTVNLRSSKEELVAKGAELHETKQLLTQIQLELNRVQSERALLRREQDEQLLLREQQLRRAHEDALDEVRRQCDDQQMKIARLETLLESKELQHSQDKASLRAELVGLQSKCDSMKFECDRLQANSPRRVARQIEQEQLKAKSEQQQREAAERRIEEHKALLENIRADLASARLEAQDARDTITRQQRQLTLLTDVLGCGAADEIVPVVNRLLADREQFAATLKRQESETSRRMDELKFDVQRLEETREKLKSESEHHYVNWKQCSQKLEKLQAAHEREIEEKVVELSRQRDWLQEELERMRVRAQKSADDFAKEAQEGRQRLEEVETTLRKTQGERDAIQRQQSEMLKEQEQLRRSLMDLQSRFGQSQSDGVAKDAIIAELESKLKESARAQHRLEQDKDRLAADASAAKALAESEGNEARQRIDDLRSKHQKEIESLRATLRLERDKVLAEVEATHKSEIRASELELTADSLKAEKDRLAKELELMKRSQSNKAESYQQLVEEATRDREVLRREIEDLRVKHAALMKDFDSLSRDKKRLEEEGEQHLRQRDMALRQLDSAKLERDVAMKSALDIRNTINAGSRSNSGGPLGPIDQQVAGGQAIRRSSPPREYNQQPPQRSGSPSEHRRISPLRSRSAAVGGSQNHNAVSWVPVHPQGSTPPPPLSEPGNLHQSYSSTPTMHYGYGNMNTSATNNSSRVPYIGTPTSQGGPSTFRSASVNVSAKEKNDALFAHFREQQHSATPVGRDHPLQQFPGTLTGVSATPAPPPVLGTPPRRGEEALPLGAYRRQ
jgi:chromosome segregation ATPase